jgi:hypothetical protein
MEEEIGEVKYYERSGEETQGRRQREKEMKGKERRKDGQNKQRGETLWGKERRRESQMRRQGRKETERKRPEGKVLSERDGGEDTLHREKSIEEQKKGKETQI